MDGMNHLWWLTKEIFWWAPFLESENVAVPAGNQIN